MCVHRVKKHTTARADPGIKRKEIKQYHSKEILFTAVVNASTGCISSGCFCYSVAFPRPSSVGCFHTLHNGNHTVNIVPATWLTSPVPNCSRRDALDVRDYREHYYVSSQSPYAGPGSEGTNGEQIQSCSADPTANDKDGKK